MIGGYFLTAILGAIVLGVARPATRRQPGALAVGGIIGALTLFCVGFTLTGGRVVFTLIGAGMGVYIADRTWKVGKRESRSVSNRDHR
jgi:hypothetical protein